MWIAKLIFLIFLPFLQAQEEPISEVTVQLEDVQDEETSKKWKLFGEMAFESKRQQLGNQRSDINPGVQNFAFGINYQFLNDLSGTFEILAEQNNDDVDVYFGQVFADYNLPFVKGFNIKAGQRYYDFGVLTGLEGLLTQRPDYYNDLLVSRRGIDLGATLLWQPAESLPLTVSYSYFTGRTFRPGDQNVENATLDPQYLRLSFRPRWFEIHATYLTREYIDRPRFDALGFEAQSKEFGFFNNRLKLSALSEAWQMTYERQDGLQREGQTFLAGGMLSFYGFFYRPLFSQETWSSQGLSDLRSNFVLNGLGYKFNKHFILEYQNIQRQQNVSSSILQNVNEEAFRLVLAL
jgi:hypothetical protein